MVTSQRAVQLTNRHIARICENLNQMEIPSMIIDGIKKEIWYLSEDLEKHYPSLADIPVFADLALAICFLKIAILEAIIGESS